MEATRRGRQVRAQGAWRAVGRAVGAHRGGACAASARPVAGVCSAGRGARPASQEGVASSGVTRRRDGAGRMGAWRRREAGSGKPWGGGRRACTTTTRWQTDSSSIARRSACSSTRFSAAGGRGQPTGCEGCSAGARQGGAGTGRTQGPYRPIYYAWLDAAWARTLRLLRETLLAQQLEHRTRAEQRLPVGGQARNPQLWGGPRRAAGAAASLQDAQTVPWGA